MLLSQIVRLPPFAQNAKNGAPLCRLYQRDQKPGPRFYDFNVWTGKKRVEKLRYMHRNPVKRGLVAAPEDWQWSSFRYSTGETGLVRVNEGWREISFRDRVA